MIRTLATAAVVLALACPAPAGGDARQLDYILFGPAIFGVAPEGKVRIDQPSLPGTLSAEVKNVNLPDGTVLVVTIVGFPVAMMELSGGEAKVQAPIEFQVRTGALEVKLLDGTVIMTSVRKI